jgi:hypothetical protein
MGLGGPGDSWLNFYKVIDAARPSATASFWRSFCAGVPSGCAARSADHSFESFRRSDGPVVPGQPDNVAADFQAMEQCLGLGRALGAAQTYGRPKVPCAEEPIPAAQKFWKFVRREVSQCGARQALTSTSTKVKTIRSQISQWTTTTLAHREQQVQVLDNRPRSPEP